MYRWIGLLWGIIAIGLMGCATGTPKRSLTTSTQGSLRPGETVRFKLPLNAGDVYLLVCKVEGGASFSLKHPSAITLEEDEDNGEFIALLVGLEGDHEFTVKARNGGDYIAVLMKDQSPWIGVVKEDEIKILKEPLNEGTSVVAVLLVPEGTGQFTVVDPQGNGIAESSTLNDGLEVASFQPVIGGEYRYLIRTNSTTTCLFATLKSPK